MANEIKLEIYKFELQHLKSKEVLNLDDFFEKADFKDFFINYIKSVDKAIFSFGKQNKTIEHHFDKLKFNSKDRVVSGIVEGGQTGLGGIIKDSRTGQFGFKKTVSHTDVKPYYFLISASEGHKAGFIAIQRTGVNTTAEPFLTHIRRYFKATYPYLRMVIDKFISKALVDKFLGGDMKEITFKRYNLPQDVTDKLLKRHSEKEMSIKISISGLDHKFTSKVIRYLENPNSKMFGIEALSEFGIDGSHDTLIHVYDGKENRTIDLGDSFNLRPYYFIDDKIKKDSDGHPVFSSIDNYSRSFIKNLEDEIFD